MVIFCLGNGSYPTFEEMVFENRTTRVRESWDAVERSLYHLHYQKWVKWFPRTQVGMLSSLRRVVDLWSNILHPGLLADWLCTMYYVFKHMSDSLCA